MNRRRGIHQINIHIPWMHCECNDWGCTNIAATVMERDGKSYFVAYSKKRRDREDCEDELTCGIHALNIPEAIEEFKRRNLAGVALIDGDHVAFFVGE
jgi:hypothetical protein